MQGKRPKKELHLTSLPAADVALAHKSESEYFEDSRASAMWSSGMSEASVARPEEAAGGRPT